jgi:natural product biosynthesis luciferase-like monooxygenase protein
MKFSVMLWGDLGQALDPGKEYQLLLELAKRADEQGYSGIWIPERHFHPWGGLYPNPSVLAAAVATCTRKIRIRAGSVVIPLHHPVRVAEEWAVVDRLSGGRVEIAAATGWREEDFLLAPDRYQQRKAQIWKDVATIQALWRGDAYRGHGPDGKEATVRIYPRPVQPELPLWVTSAGSLRTMCDAGGSGFNLLTHLLGQSYDDLDKKVRQYQAYRVRGGFKTGGEISLMLHTFLAHDLQAARDTARGPLSRYLEHSADVSIPAEQRAQWEQLGERDRDQLKALAFERYYNSASLIGTPESCRPVVERLARMGVTEICCLVDFGLPCAQVLESLDLLTALKRSVASATAR